MRQLHWRTSRVTWKQQVWIHLSLSLNYKRNVLFKLHLQILASLKWGHSKLSPTVKWDTDTVLSLSVKCQLLLLLVTLPYIWLDSHGTKVWLQNTNSIYWILGESSSLVSHFFKMFHKTAIMVTTAATRRACKAVERHRSLQFFSVFPKAFSMIKPKNKST